jgi:hypothetical protein
MLFRRYYCHISPYWYFQLFSAPFHFHFSLFRHHFIE